MTRRVAISVTGHTVFDHGMVSRRGPVVKPKPGAGRKSKGDRDMFAVRPMRPVGDAIREAADDLGMTYGDFCCAILARAMGLPEFAPPAPEDGADQMPLPLDKTA